MGREDETVDQSPEASNQKPETEMRLFVAADLPDAAREALAAEQTRIKASLAGSAGIVRWVRPEQSHLTLVFLGEVSDARVAGVVDAVGRNVPGAAFEITLESVGVFPPRGAPRVLWVGVGAGTAPLVELQRRLAERITALGVPLEERPFHPHLTLARWRESRPTDRDRALKAAPRGAIARAVVAGATLYQSRLSSAGPSHIPLARAALRPV
jgi:2'-5' RNA ligase